MNKAIAVFIIGSFLVTSLSCTLIVRLPADNWEKGEYIEEGRHWLIKEKSGAAYAVARFSMTDSTLVIQLFDYTADAAEGITGGPYVLRLEDIASIARIEKWKDSPAGKITRRVLYGAVFVGLGFLLVLSGFRIS